MRSPVMDARIDYGGCARPLLLRSGPLKHVRLCFAKAVIPATETHIHVLTRSKFLLLSSTSDITPIEASDY
jgi:hypothetical protein